MSGQIWKFPLRLDDEVSVEMPLGAVVLCVQAQRDQLCLWARINPNEKVKHARWFHIVGTGHWMPDEPGRYVGTVQMNGGALVWHVFEQEG